MGNALERHGTCVDCNGPVHEYKFGWMHVNAREPLCGNTIKIAYSDYRLSEDGHPLPTPPGVRDGMIRIRIKGGLK